MEIDIQSLPAPKPAKFNSIKQNLTGSGKLGEPLEFLKIFCCGGDFPKKNSPTFFSGNLFIVLVKLVQNHTNDTKRRQPLNLLTPRMCSSVGQFNF